MPRLAPRIGVSLLVTLLFGPLTSIANDSDDKSSEAKWQVVVAGHSTWTGKNHEECTDRAKATSGQCVPVKPQEGGSKQVYCPEVNPGMTVQCHGAKDNAGR